MKLDGIVIVLMLYSVAAFVYGSDKVNMHADEKTLTCHTFYSTLYDKNVLTFLSYFTPGF